MLLVTPVLLNQVKMPAVKKVNLGPRVIKLMSLAGQFKKNCFIKITLKVCRCINCPHGRALCLSKKVGWALRQQPGSAGGFKCLSSFTAFLIWAWSAESGMRSAPLWADGLGSSPAAVCCLWTHLGFSCSGHFHWHRHELLSAWSHLWPEEPAKPS